MPYQFDEKDIVRNLLQHGVDIGAMATTDEVTTGEAYGVLHAAARERNSDILELLLQYGADINQLDCDGQIPLFYAIQPEDCVTARKLIPRGFDLTIVSKTEKLSILHSPVGCIERGSGTIQGSFEPMKEPLSQEH